MKHCEFARLCNGAALEEPPGGVVWLAADGTPAYTIIELQACEEINEQETRAMIQADLPKCAAPDAARWLRTAIEGAGLAWPDAVVWHKPGSYRDPVADHE